MDILHRINWVDIFIVIVMLRASYLAFQHGLSHEIFPLFGACLMVSVALRYYTTLSGLFARYVLNLPPSILDLAGFIAILVGAGFFCKVVGGLLENIIKVTWHPFVERFGGLLIGVIKASVVTSMCIIVLMLVPLSYLQQSVRDRSLMGARFMRIGPNIYEHVARFMPRVAVEKLVASKDELVRRLAENKSIFSGAKQVEGSQPL